MSISSGSIGGGAVSDLELIYQGGANFMDRLKAMSDAKDAAAQALADLNLGNDIAGVHAAAVALRDEAEKIKEAARKSLDDAYAEAEGIAKDAAANAQRMIDDAQQKAKDILSLADTAKNDADSYASRINREAEDAQRKANESLRAAAANEADITAKVNAAEVAKAAADKAKQEFEAAKKDFEDRVAQIRTIMG